MADLPADVLHDHKVDVLFVDVGPDDCLIIRQVFGREFLCDFRRQFRGDFSRLEGLNDMIALASIQLSDGPLGIHHLPVL